MQNPSPYMGVHRNNEENKKRQVDILISKNQALQILYLKNHAYKTL